MDGHRNEDVENLSGKLKKLCADDQQQTNAHEEEAPLPHLPEEVWEKVLNYLTYFEDIGNASSACKDWERILYPKQNLWMLPAVLPLVSKYLDRRSILRCRRACKNWRQGVDKYFEGLLSKPPYSEARQTRCLESREIWQESRRFPYKFHFDGNRRRDSEHNRRYYRMKDHPGNPFIGGGVVFTYENTSPWRSYIGIDYEKSLSFIFGHHIKFLEQVWVSPKTGLVDMLATACSALSRMPNLVQYRISVSPFLPERIYSNNKTTEELLEKTKLLLSKIELPHLKTLLLEIWSPSGARNLNRLYLDDLLIRKSCHQLLRLETRRWDLAWTSLHWRNLVDLRFSIDRDYGTVMEHLLQLNSTKLKRLHVCIEVFAEGDGDKLVKVLKKFPDLVSFGITFKFCTCSGETWPNVRGTMKAERFPRITNLVVNHRPVSKEFLRQFPNLQYLDFPTPEPVHKQAPFPRNVNGWTIVLTEVPLRTTFDHFAVDKTMGLLSLAPLQQLTLGGMAFKKDKRMKKCCLKHLWKCVQPQPDQFLKNESGAMEYKWEWNKFNYGFSAGAAVKEVYSPVCELYHFTHLKAISPDFSTADFWMRKVSNFQELFLTVKKISFSHLPIFKDFLICFPNLKCLELPFMESSRHMFCKARQDPILYESNDDTKNVLDSCSIGSDKLIYESRVWELFPSLDRISIVKDVNQNGGHKVTKELYACTREDYKIFSALQM